MVNQNHAKRSTLSSLINVKSRLPILKNFTLHKEISAFHVYWFLRFFSTLHFAFIAFMHYFFPDNPTLHVYSKLHISCFCNFCTPSRLFQPPRLLQRWEYMWFIKQDKNMKGCIGNKKVLYSAEKSSVIWDEPHSRGSA